MDNNYYPPKMATFLDRREWHQALDWRLQWWHRHHRGMRALTAEDSALLHFPETIVRLNYDGIIPSPVQLIKDIVNIVLDAVNTYPINYTNPYRLLSIYDDDLAKVVYYLARYTYLVLPLNQRSVQTLFLPALEPYMGQGFTRETRRELATFEAMDVIVADGLVAYLRDQRIENMDQLFAHILTLDTYYLIFRDPLAESFLLAGYYRLSH